ncbi:hypothetical protein SUDANB38_00410 [Streptomyces sp. enrichment culture]
MSRVGHPRGAGDPYGMPHRAGAARHGAGRLVSARCREAGTGAVGSGAGAAVPARVGPGAAGGLGTVPGGRYRRGSDPVRLSDPLPGRRYRFSTVPSPRPP